MRVIESTAIVKYHGHGHYKHFFRGVYCRAVKVSSRLGAGMRVLSTFEVFIDIRNLGWGEEKKKKKKKSIWKLRTARFKSKQIREGGRRKGSGAARTRNGQQMACQGELVGSPFSMHV